MRHDPCEGSWLGNREQVEHALPEGLNKSLWYLEMKKASATSILLSRPVPPSADF